MNLLILLAFALAAPLAVVGQSVCTDEETPDSALLTICEHSSAMASRPQPRLYLRVLNDGCAQYEINERNNPNKLNKIALREIFINGTEVQDLVRFGDASDLRSANDKYPAFNQGADLRTETTVTFRGLDEPKIITLHNYAPSDPDNYKHYPDSLNRLMYLAEEVRLRAFGMKRAVPAITYCEALKNSRQYLGKRVSIYADLDYTMAHPYLTDQCTATATGAILPRRIGVQYNELGKKYGSISSVIENARLKPFYGRARLLASGRLNDDGTGEDLYTFEIDESLQFHDLVLPYQGSLKPGWTYADTFSHPGGQDIKLSQAPIVPEEVWRGSLDGMVGVPKILPSHAVRIEWTNLADFPRLQTPGLTGLTFHVLSATTKRITRTRWITTYTCEILKIEKVRGQITNDKSQALRLGAWDFGSRTCNFQDAVLGHFRG